MSRILLVEDDEKLAKLTARYLEENQFSVDICPRGDMAVSQFLQHPAQLVILDIMLPGLDGIGVCRSLRQHFDGPILMLTAKDSAIDQVIGLEAGADDYVNKPADPMVLLARVRSLLRRVTNSQVQPQQDIVIGSLHISNASQNVFLAKQQLELSTQEYDLLHHLAQNAGRVLSRDDLMKGTKGRPFDGLDRSVDVRISKLRKKLHDDLNSPQRIKTVWGKGYLLAPDGFACD